MQAQKYARLDSSSLVGSLSRKSINEDAHRESGAEQKCYVGMLGIGSAALIYNVGNISFLGSLFIGLYKNPRAMWSVALDIPRISHAVIKFIMVCSLFTMYWTYIEPSLNAEKDRLQGKEQDKSCRRKYCGIFYYSTVDFWEKSMLRRSMAGGFVPKILAGAMVLKIVSDSLVVRETTLYGSDLMQNPHHMGCRIKSPVLEFLGQKYEQPEENEEWTITTHCDKKYYCQKKEFDGSKCDKCKSKVGKELLCMLPGITKAITLETSVMRQPPFGDLLHNILRSFPVLLRSLPLPLVLARFLDTTPSTGRFPWEYSFDFTLSRHGHRKPALANLKRSNKAMETLFGGFTKQKKRFPHDFFFDYWTTNEAQWTVHSNRSSDFDFISFDALRDYKKPVANLTQPLHNEIALLKLWNAASNKLNDYNVEVDSTSFATCQYECGEMLFPTQKVSTVITVLPEVLAGAVVVDRFSIYVLPLMLSALNRGRTKFFVDKDDEPAQLMRIGKVLRNEARSKPLAVLRLILHFIGILTIPKFVEAFSSAHNAHFAFFDGLTAKCLLVSAGMVCSQLIGIRRYMPFPNSLWYDGEGTFWISVEKKSTSTMEQKDVTLASWVQMRASSQFEILMFMARGISIKEAEGAEKILETVINKQQEELLKTDLLEMLPLPNQIRQQLILRICSTSPPASEAALVATAASESEKKQLIVWTTQVQETTTQVQETFEEFKRYVETLVKELPQDEVWVEVLVKDKLLKTLLLPNEIRKQLILRTNPVQEEEFRRHVETLVKEPQDEVWVEVLRKKDLLNTLLLPNEIRKQLILQTTQVQETFEEFERHVKTSLENICPNEAGVANNEDIGVRAEKKVLEQMREIINKISQNTKAVGTRRDCIVPSDGPAKDASDKLKMWRAQLAPDSEFERQQNIEFDLCAIAEGADDKEINDFEIVTVLQEMKVTMRRKKKSKTGHSKWTYADEIIPSWQMGILLGPGAFGQFRVLLADGGIQKAGKYISLDSGISERESQPPPEAEADAALLGPRIADVPALTVISARHKWEEVSKLWHELRDRTAVHKQNADCCPDFANVDCWPDFANAGWGLASFGYLWPVVIFSYCLYHHYETGGRMQDEFVANLLLFAAMLVFTPCYIIYAGLRTFCPSPDKKDLES